MCVRDEHVDDVLLHAYIHTYIHIYINTYTHTHKHKYRHFFVCMIYVGLASACPNREFNPITHSKFVFHSKMSGLPIIIIFLIEGMFIITLNH